MRIADGAGPMEQSTKRQYSQTKELKQSIRALGPGSTEFIDSAGPFTRIQSCGEAAVVANVESAQLIVGVETQRSPSIVNGLLERR
jgi:hypothetical protein